ncbi:urease accessory protein UreD [Paenibacillus sp. IB182496]|uniref:Urease accessory protein UreD n=1 Tax=Paenibacillus sabuli TaxID=2772509 RepID=A0A927BPV4_9BACL|nr:urease accessory protein UreD [Paenibacillus sabuli]MBD2844528.1 urease accessory protein UreD [Paenibacillus sabuli]
MPKASNIATPESAKPAAVGLTARLRARFVRHGERTALAERYHSAPLKIAKSFPLRERQLGVIVMDVSPGMLAGDRYELEWVCEAGTHAYVTNQSYTKVHPSEPAHPAMLRQRYVLGPDAVCEAMMEPLMLYREAALDNRTEVRLAPGAVWMQSEVLCPGRALRGERFAYRRLDNRLRVQLGEELIFAQRQLIVPQEQRLGAPGAWGDATHAGMFYCMGDRVQPNHAGAVRQALGELPVRDRSLRWGVSPAYRHGLTVSVLGDSAWAVQEALHRAWSAARAALLELTPLQFRK